MTEEELVTQGDEAEALLANSAFNACVNTLVEGTFTTYVNSDPADDAGRETNYRHYRALVDVANTLKQWVAVRDEINERVISAVEDDDNSQEELTDHG